MEFRLLSAVICFLRLLSFFLNFVFSNGPSGAMEKQDRGEKFFAPCMTFVYLCGNKIALLLTERFINLSVLSLQVLAGTGHCRYPEVF